MSPSKRANSKWSGDSFFTQSKKTTQNSFDDNEVVWYNKNDEL